MSFMFAILMLVVAAPGAFAQPADCPTEPSSGQTLPLTLDLSGRGTPSRPTGQVYIDVPSGPPGMACHDTQKRSPDILGGEPGDLLRGPGTPHVRVEMQ